MLASNVIILVRNVMEMLIPAQAAKLLVIEKVIVHVQLNIMMITLNVKPVYYLVSNVLTQPPA